MQACTRITFPPGLSSPPNPPRPSLLGGAVTRKHPAEEEISRSAGEHMKREVLLHRGHGLPDAVMHDVEHVDANRETGACAAGTKAVTRPGFTCGGGVADQRQKLFEP